MKFARVVGKVVATQKVESLSGVKLLVLQPLDEHMEEEGEPYVAADCGVGAGPGDRVFVVLKRDATMAFDDPFIPVDAAIVGIVDEAAVEGE